SATVWYRKQAHRRSQHAFEQAQPRDAGSERASPVGLVVDAGPLLLGQRLDTYGHRRRREREGHAGKPRNVHVTSASRIGGTCRCVIVGERPTTSDAISSASFIVDAAMNPRRRTARGSPPTMITRPRCWSACAPQYHM